MAAAGLRHQQPVQAHLRVTPPHRGAPAGRLPRMGAARLEAVGLGHQPADRIAQQALVLGELEVHFSPSTFLAMMFFWISEEPP